MNPDDQYNECLLAMKCSQRESIVKSGPSLDFQADSNTPSGRIRERATVTNVSSAPEKTSRGSIIASMVPDEVVLQDSNYSPRRYEAALMFVDVSGFTDLCERYTKADSGGPSRLTQVLNSYIGAMVQEILTHGGDVLNFSGDALLSMWKKSPRLAMQNVVHSAIDCGLSVQKNYGTYHTDVGVVLKVKVAISAGVSHFALIGDATHSHYLILGQPVWDVKIAEYLASAGDVMTAASCWIYLNKAEYVTEPFGDGRHTKVLQPGVSWKRVGHAHASFTGKERTTSFFDPSTGETENYYREFSLRPVIVSALRSSWSSLRKFMVKPVIWAVENDEPMEFLTEIRRVIIVFLNIVTKAVTDEVLLGIVDTAFKCVYSISSASDGLLNKVSMFDKDLMFLLVFGLRGMTHEDEAQKSLLCAQALKESLVDPNITSISIGISSGTTYCGVVGHVLRREYTVIGSAVNKAARLMMTYPNKLTCDKETFLRSKMDQQMFRLMEFKPMKGIIKPGPVYEFNKNGWSKSESSRRHGVLGRDEELRMFITTLQNAIQHQHQPFARPEDHVYGVAIVCLERLRDAFDFPGIPSSGPDLVIMESPQEYTKKDTTNGLNGPAMVGKKRFMEECIYITPNCFKVLQISLSQSDKIPYELFRQIALKMLTGDPKEDEVNMENEICNRVHINVMSPVQIHAINTIFGCHFALPQICEETPTEIIIKNVVSDVFKNIPLWIVGIAEAIYIDDESWRLLLVLMDLKIIFVILTITDQTTMSDEAQECLSSNMLLKMPLSGLEHWYHSAVACQFLDVQGIPADLEKLIQSASDGKPGWIQNFIISLVQQGDLSIATVMKTTALEDGTVVPPPPLLNRAGSIVEYDDLISLDEYFKEVLARLNLANTHKSKISFTMHKNDYIQVAVLADTYEVLNVNMSTDADATILKTYDSLTPFEKMLLKCGSVIGLAFPRRMMQYLLQCESPRKIAEAVEKLFLIGVLECEGGDFTKKTSKVLVHAVPELEGIQPPYCSCLGAKRLADCNDLPDYAFCGYMRFKHPLFRTTTYELLTETQKREMHARALLYLEHNTRRCWYCGSGCFRKMVGHRTPDGLIDVPTELKLTQEAIQGLAAETHHVTVDAQSTITIDFKISEQQAHASRMVEPMLLGSERSLIFEEREPLDPKDDGIAGTDQRVRSFSSLDMSNCECLAIAMFVYSQIIDHCRGAGEHVKLFEAYLEYADLCAMNSNTTQALRLLNEAESFILSSQASGFGASRKIPWFKDFCLGRISSLRGGCMLESGELLEARAHLYRALELFRDPFPITKHSKMVRRIQFSIHKTTLKLTPRAYMGNETGLVGLFYEEVAVTLNRLFKLFSERKEFSNAEITAKWSLDYARRTNANFQLLCESYGNMITVHLHNREFLKCVELETLAMELCHRKRGILYDSEMRAVVALYTSMFFFYIGYGMKNKSLEFGFPLMHMVSKLQEPDMREVMVTWMLKLLLNDLRIQEMVMLMKEYLYLDDDFEISAMTWYYFYSLVILIDTGYSVESYRNAEWFYVKTGDAILQAKTRVNLAWDVFACMWLISVRVDAWERTVFWEEKIREILSLEINQIEKKSFLQCVLLEGLLIMLMREIDTSNISKIAYLQKNIKKMSKILRKSCQETPTYLPRYFLLSAYYCYIRGKKYFAHRRLEKSLAHAKKLGEGTVIIWVEHTRQHWAGTLDPALEDYWTEHTEPDNLLDYKDFSDYKLIIPYTLPVPKIMKE